MPRVPRSERMISGASTVVFPRKAAGALLNADAPPPPEKGKMGTCDGGASEGAEAGGAGEPRAGLDASPAVVGMALDPAVVGMTTEKTVRGAEDSPEVSASDNGAAEAGANAEPMDENDVVHGRFWSTNSVGTGSLGRGCLRKFSAVRIIHSS